MYMYNSLTACNYKLWTRRHVNLIQLWFSYFKTTIVSYHILIAHCLMDLHNLIKVLFLSNLHGMSFVFRWSFVVRTRQHVSLASLLVFTFGKEFLDKSLPSRHWKAMERECCAYRNGTEHNHKTEHNHIMYNITRVNYISSIHNLEHQVLVCCMKV